MSYDLAVWEGEMPTDNKHALKIYFEKLDHLDQAGYEAEPSPAIRAYIEALLERWPDIGEAGGDASPWSDGPLMNNAAGSIFYFGMSGSQADEASRYCADLAKAHGLVCFDPQEETLRP